MADSGSFFPDLQPPDGGLGRLRHRLLSERRRRRGITLLGAVGAASIVAVAALGPWTLDRTSPDLLSYAVNARPTMIRLGLLEMPAEPVRAAPSSHEPQGLMEMSLAFDGVRFYWVETLAGNGKPDADL